MVQQRNSYTKLIIRSLFAALFIASFAFGGCTDDLSTVGSNFIPENERFQVKVDTSYDIDAYTLKNDTIHTDNFVVGLLGAMTNPLLGSTSASFASEIYPKVYDSLLYNPKYQPTYVDSVYFTFEVTGYLGLKGKAMRVNIYELNEPLNINNLTSSYDFTGKYKSQSLADTNITGVGTYKIEINDTTITRPLGRRLIKTTKEEVYSAAAFRKNNYGIYFRVDPAEAMGTFYKIDYSTVVVIVKFHYLGGIKKDVKGEAHFSLKNLESIGDGTDTTKGKANRVISLVHDRTTATVNLDNVNQLSTDTVIYVSSMGGAMGGLDFEKYKNWQDSVPCVISRAELVIEQLKPDITEMSLIPSKLGLFQKNSTGKLVPIIDLGYESNAAGTYSGLFQKGLLRYSANISRYFQKFVNDKTTPSVLYLMPMSSGQTSINQNTVFYNDYTYGVLRGSKVPSRIKLIITYSKLKK